MGPTEYKLGLRAARSVYEKLGATKVKELGLPDLPAAPAAAVRAPRASAAASAPRARSQRAPLPSAKRPRRPDDDDEEESDMDHMELIDDDDDEEHTQPLQKAERGITQQLQAINGKLAAMPNHTDDLNTIRNTLSEVVSTVEGLGQTVEGMGKKEESIQNSEKFRQMTAILSTMASLIAVLEPPKSDTAGGQSDARGQSTSLQRMCDSQYHNICNLVENIFNWSKQEQTNLYSSLKSIEYFRLKLNPALDK